MGKIITYASLKEKAMDVVLEKHNHTFEMLAKEDTQELFLEPSVITEPTVVERIVEVPVIEERIVEVIQEKIVIEERIVEVIKYVDVIKEVEVIKEVVVEKIVLDLSAALEEKKKREEAEKKIKKLHLAIAITAIAAFIIGALSV